MRTGAGLALICVGAILAFAVTAHASVINVQAVGWILMLTGLIGLLMPRRAYGWLGRRMLVRRTRSWPGAGPGADSGTSTVPVDRVEEIPVPPYLSHNPGTSRARAGLPPKPTLQREPYPPGPDAEGDSEVIEDLYEQ
ncbi:MAG TPA: DUF6458 family protein [Trebonia sp.]